MVMAHCREAFAVFIVSNESFKGVDGGEVGGRMRKPAGGCEAGGRLQSRREAAKPQRPP